MVFTCPNHYLCSPQAARLHHTYQSSQMPVQMPYIVCKLDVSSLGSPGETEARDTWINFFPPLSKADSWNYLSVHSAEKMGEYKASIIPRLHLHFTPGGQTVQDISELLELLARPKPVLWGTLQEKLESYTCEPSPFLPWVELRQGVSFLLYDNQPEEGTSVSGCPESPHWFLRVQFCIHLGCRSLSISL